MASDQPCYFWKLPQEIHDMIFKLACGEEYTGRFVTSDGWRCRKNNKLRERGRGYTVKPFATHKVNDFMVSKEFLVNAAKAWVQAQKLAAGLDSGSRGLFTWDLTKSGLFRQFGVEIECALWHSSRLADCVGLKSVTIRIDYQTFERNNKFPWLDEYADRDFAQMDYVKDFARVMSRSARPVACEYQPQGSCLSIREDRNVKDRLGRQPRIFSNVSKAAKKDLSVAKRDIPLYAGSKVRFGRSMPQQASAGHVTRGGGIALRATKDEEKSAPQTADEMLKMLSMSLEEFWRRFESGRVWIF